jgi:uncharacterized protein YdhG (YjbR/CyaY superfamily)
MAKVRKKSALYWHGICYNGEQSWNWGVELAENDNWQVRISCSYRRLSTRQWNSKSHKTNVASKMRFNSQGFGEDVKIDLAAPKNIDEYIAGFPRHIQAIMGKIRLAVRTAAPGAEEKISYRMPAFSLKGNLVYFAAFRKHIGFYPAPTGTEKFQKELSIYKSGKGSIQFPLDQPIPYALISKIVKFRVKENLERATAKVKKT